MMCLLIIREWIGRSYPEEYAVADLRNKEINRIIAFLDVLRFRVVDDKFGSWVMNRISKDVAQGLVLVILFMMVMVLLATLVMVMMAIFSFLMVMVSHKDEDQRKRIRQERQ